MTHVLLIGISSVLQATYTAHHRITGLTTVKTEGSTQTTALAVTLFINIDDLTNPIISEVWITASKIDIA